MKALVYTGPNQLVVREVPDPQPHNDEVVVRVDSVGICGSDMHAYHGFDSRRPPPLILGHEAAGVALSGRLQGRRLTINPLVTCGACTTCPPGHTHRDSTPQIQTKLPRTAPPHPCSRRPCSERFPGRCEPAEPRFPDLNQRLLPRARVALG